ncbi:MAG TPA: hypothetical protein VK653_03060 [Xanthobacteraceae bacterium]|nr:hypothetical protein [Xanthobacteraceae bacterium]
MATYVDRILKGEIQKRCIAAASGLTNVKPFPEVAAWRRADPFARAEYLAQAMHVGARGKDDRAFERLVDVRIGLQMRDQFGIGVDGVANAGAAKRLDFDRRRISGDPKICGRRRPTDHRQRKHQEADGANSKSPYPGQGWMPPNHGEENRESKAHKWMIAKQLHPGK